ncbi:MAG: hypothetical protein V1918_10360, partial [Planctomycetota bacterium]
EDELAHLIAWLLNGAGGLFAPVPMEEMNTTTETVAEEGAAVLAAAMETRLFSTASEAAPSSGTESSESEGDAPSSASSQKTPTASGDLKAWVASMPVRLGSFLRNLIEAHAVPSEIPQNQAPLVGGLARLEALAPREMEALAQALSVRLLAAEGLPGDETPPAEERPAIETGEVLPNAASAAQGAPALLRMILSRVGTRVLAQWIASAAREAGAPEALCDEATLAGLPRPILKGLALLVLRRDVEGIDMLAELDLQTPQRLLQATSIAEAETGAIRQGGEDAPAPVGTGTSPAGEPALPAENVPQNPSPEATGEVSIHLVSVKESEESAFTKPFPATAKETGSESVGMEEAPSFQDLEPQVKPTTLLGAKAPRLPRPVEVASYKPEAHASVEMTLHLNKVGDASGNVEQTNAKTLRQVTSHLSKGQAAAGALSARTFRIPLSMWRQVPETQAV